MSIYCNLDRSHNHTSRCGAKTGKIKAIYPPNDCIVRVMLDMFVMGN